MVKIGNYNIKVDLVFPGGLVVKNPPANAGDTGLIPDRGRSHMPRGNQASVSPLLKPMHPREAMAMRSLCSGATDHPLLPATRESS